MENKYFFGWSNIKFVIKEAVKTLSDGSSFFAKKRIESAIAFIVGQCGMVSYLTIHLATMTTSDIALWAGVEFSIAGYIISQIQKEKKDISKPEDNV